MREEYPRPQFQRNEWLCLNGEWDFQIDNAMSGEAAELYNKTSFAQKINVPFCPESKLSGIENTDFMNCVWYTKTITLPDSFHGKRVMLHIDAVDYFAKLWIDGRFVAFHRGGYTPFNADISDYVSSSEVRVTVCAYDDVRSSSQPSGKQSSKLNSYGCFYTRTTGIWQSVWMEPVSNTSIEDFKVDTDINSPSVTVRCKFNHVCNGDRLIIKTFYQGGLTGEKECVLSGDAVCTTVSLSETHLWSVGHGELYDLKLLLVRNGNVLDEISGYFGLRSIGLDKKGMMLNGEYIFGRWVLDQGFYPDGIYTAPSDDAFRKDIEASMCLGFNGARLHEKVFEPRFLYWADRLGYLVWDEYPNWGLDISDVSALGAVLPEWIEEMNRDYNHPSIIGWCPFNETADKTGKQCDDVLRIVYMATKAVDITRPVIDTSGFIHVITDIFDVHDYEQDPEKFADNYDQIDRGIVNDMIQRDPNRKSRQSYDSKLPVFVSEYGGIRWVMNDDNPGWGYGVSVQSENEFIERYRGLTNTLLDNPNIMALCYTQLYDVEQEQNGLMTYDRRFKFNPEIFRRINSRKAAIED